MHYADAYCADHEDSLTGYTNSLTVMGVFTLTFNAIITALPSDIQPTQFAYSILTRAIPLQRLHLPNNQSMMAPAVTTRGMARGVCRTRDYMLNRSSGPCGCGTCMDCDPNAEFDPTLIDYGEESDRTEEAQNSDASEESEIFHFPRHSDQVPLTTLDKFPSIADLQILLRKHYPQYHATLPSHNVLNFEDWVGSRVQKRVQIGIIRTPFDPVRHAVYAFIGGENRNRVCLIYGSANKSLPLRDADAVELEEPFFSICRNGRLLHDEEYGRLRALLCFWFFTAGHLNRLTKYKNLEKHLVKACQWLGEAMLQQEARKNTEAATGSDADATMRDTDASAAKQPPNPKKRDRLPWQQHRQAEADESESFSMFEICCLTYL